MVSIKWCLKQKNGIEIVEPNTNMSDSYLKMAEESIRILAKMEESAIWTATTSYYIYYYSLYALMLKIGVKCEIHSCSIAFMKELLGEFYTVDDIRHFEDAFNARKDLQYYADRPVDKKIVNESKRYCKIFFIKTKDITTKITEKQIQQIRKSLTT